jgi:hypothetical protein
MTEGGVEVITEGRTPSISYYNLADLKRLPKHDNIAIKYVGNTKCNGASR